MSTSAIVGPVLLFIAGIVILIIGLISRAMYVAIFGGLWSIVAFIIVIISAIQEPRVIKEPKTLEDIDLYVKKPKVANDFHLLGIQHYNFGHYTDALKFFNKAIELDQNNAWYWVNKGDTLQKLGKFEEAIESYEESLQIDPSNQTAKTQIEQLRKV